MALYLMISASACTWTHRIVLTYEVPDAPAQNAEWQRAISTRVNNIATVLTEQQKAQLDRLEEKGAP